MCNGTFVSPKVLPCFHTFCQHCLERCQVIGIIVMIISATIDCYHRHWYLRHSGTLCRIRLTLKPFAHFPRCYPQPCSRGSTTSSASLSWSSSSVVPGPPREDHMPVLPVWLSAGTCGRCRFVKQNQHFNLNQYILYKTLSFTFQIELKRCWY